MGRLNELQAVPLLKVGRLEPSRGDTFRRHCLSVADLPLSRQWQLIYRPWNDERLSRPTRVRNRTWIFDITITDSCRLKVELTRWDWATWTRANGHILGYDVWYLDENPVTLNCRWNLIDIIISNRFGRDRHINYNISQFQPHTEVSKGSNKSSLIIMDFGSVIWRKLSIQSWR